MITVKGLGASSGVAIGPIVLVERTDVIVPETANPIEALGDAIRAVGAHLAQLGAEARQLDRAEAADVLQAQSLMAEDPMLFDAVEEQLGAGLSLNDALNVAAEALRSMLASLPDPYLAARASDVVEVTDRVKRRLAGLDLDDTLDIAVPSVVLAPVLTAAETARLDPDLVIGFATAEGGATSHVAIIARAMGLPAVVGVSGLLTKAVGSKRVALDGDTGELVLDPDERSEADFRARAELHAATRLAAERFRGLHMTFGGNDVSIAANVANNDDVDRAAAEQADGIGLFRTEFLFLDRPSAPTEDEQHEVYSRAARSFSQPVVIRTFDIGGDKPADFLDLDAEENPFLGRRGVRLYESHGDLFGTQMRAILRAATDGDVWVMVPMVANVAEMVAVRQAVDQARTELQNRGVAFGEIKLGAMVEVPSAALCADRLAPHIDFFSIGTNDLTQYTLAADRGNPSLDHLGDHLHPAVLRLCELTAEAGRRFGKPVSVCGMAASEPEAAAAFLSMGITKLSVAPPLVNLTKSILSRLDPTEVAAAARLALSATSSADARRALVSVVRDE